MRIDVVSIFPDYLAPLQLSLPGRAIERGLLSLHVHDLRDWATDRHRTVDDTPYGGGAGMVMSPVPWGDALDSLGLDTAVLIVPTPSGERLTQALAAELSQADHLIVACGRYEGIDQRVMDHARTRTQVREISLGDYVLNGGEVAAMAIIESVIRLLPGFMGNAESTVEESHSDGLLEYPVFTKPASWRDLEVPDVLLSGDHGRIAQWRHDEQVRRTVERRPDLLSPSVLDDDTLLRPAEPADAGELLTLQRACWVSEQQLNPDVSIDALSETLDQVRAWLSAGVVLLARRHGRLVGAVRGCLGDGPHGPVWVVGRLMVAPDLQGQGLGRHLLERIESCAPPQVTAYSLMTGAGSERNQRIYRKAGYRPVGSKDPLLVTMEKRRRR